MFPYCKLKEKDILNYLPCVSAEQVEASLCKPHPAFSDFLNFLSPAAAGMLDRMREFSAKVKLRHFGKTVRLYAPLYISSYCINSCVYCAFKASHSATTRKRLSMEEIIEEAKVIKSYGMDSILIVSGEDPKAVSVDFLVEMTHELRKMFSYISIEIFPMDSASYRRLFEAGVHGLTMYQETYDHEIYKTLHPSGPKSDYHKRLEFVAGGAEAGFYNIGIGALLGLSDWRTEMVSLAAHGLWLRKHYWKSKINFSFPRITAIPGGYTPPSSVNDAELEQIMLAFRLFFHESDIFISTREPHEFRKKMAMCCATHVSAGSQVVPGGYCKAEERKSLLGQFTVTDQSSPEMVRDDLQSCGLETVYKDWDACIGA